MEVGCNQAKKLRKEKRTNMSATPSSCLLQSWQSKGFVHPIPSPPPNTLTLQRSWSSSSVKCLISWWLKHSNYDGVFLHAAHCLMHSTIVHSALLATANYSRTSHIYHISHLTIPTISAIKVFFRLVLPSTRIVSIIKRTQCSDGLVNRLTSILKSLLRIIPVNHIKIYGSFVWSWLHII